MSDCPGELWRLPVGAPLQQFVLTVPFEVRARLAYGYECHVLDLVAGQRVFPREEGDGGDLSG